MNMKNRTAISITTSDVSKLLLSYYLVNIIFDNITLFPNSTHLGLKHNQKRFGSQVLQEFHVSENKIR